MGGYGRIWLWRVEQTRSPWWSCDPCCLGIPGRKDSRIKINRVQWCATSGFVMKSFLAIGARLLQCAVRHEQRDLAWGEGWDRDWSLLQSSTGLFARAIIWMVHTHGRTHACTNERTNGHTNARTDTHTHAEIANNLRETTLNSEPYTNVKSTKQVAIWSWEHSGGNAIFSKYSKFL